MSSDYLQRYPSPYGTSVGDIWSGEDSEIGRRLMERDGLVLIHEVFEDGEKLYCVDQDNPDPEMQDLLARARAGTALWVEAQARRN